MRRHRQIAALPYRRRPDGTFEVCLITSRETGRWVLPKGWPMRGKTNWEAAAREAYEEAGLVGEIEQTPVGRYPYWKRLTAHFVLIDATVYLMRVEKLMNKWPEKSQRKRCWMSLSEAAEEVLEPGLIAIFMQLEEREGRLCRKASTGQPAVAALR